MPTRLFRRKKTLLHAHDIDPDEIFLDAHNLPQFDTHQLEGRLPLTIAQGTGRIFFIVFLFVIGGCVWRLVDLQIVNGAAYRTQSEENRLEQGVIFQPRGIIYDRTTVPLAWNAGPMITNATSSDRVHDEALEVERVYINAPGFGHILGYVSHPKKDRTGVYYQTEMVGMSGVERKYNEMLAGKAGRTISEKNARGETVSRALLEPAEPGSPLYLTIDAAIQEEFARAMAERVRALGFRGGAGVILDVTTGDVLALVSVPDIDPSILSSGKDRAAIGAYQKDPRTPFLNRALAGLYSPGSTVKPFFAFGALAEGVITPEKQIYSPGFISLPNPYDTGHPSVFKDWKAHGWVDMRRAIAVSSDVYFYEIGGGFENQRGMGIGGINKYAELFGLGTPTDIDIEGEGVGTVPNPAWKERVFPGDPWRIGDTYHTAIGQYGFQVTPLQMARAVAGIANGGFLPTPHLYAAREGTTGVRIDIPSAPTYFKVVAEGMRLAVTNGTVGALSMPNVAVAAKTGTAELGTAKKRVNSWVIGFFPYEKPHYSFAVVMENGPVTGQIGATLLMRDVLDWVGVYAPQYFK